MDSDFAGKKETVYNLWMLEFKEFKENLISIAEIKDLIARFKISGEELTEHKDRIYNEELYLLRQEMKIKDDLVNSLKQNFENERKNLVEVIDSYKKTIDSKVNLFEDIVNQKKKEFVVLKNEKERLKGIEMAKAKVKYLFKKLIQLTENEMLFWNEQKELIKKILNEHSEVKNKEVSFLKNQLELMQNEHENSRKSNEANLKKILESVESQLNLFKERELFTVSQLLDLEEKFGAYRNEKGKTITLLKDEIEQLKGYNLLLSKINTDKI